MSAQQQLTKEYYPLIVALAVGAIPPLLDTTLINIAVEDIALHLNAPLSTAQWTVTGYALAAAAAVSVSAWGVRQAGARKLWLGGLWLLLASTLLCALARTIEGLVAARVLQGIATGLLLPTLQTIVVIAVGPTKTKAVLATIAVPSIIIPIVGAAGGGVALGLLGWRMVFWLQIPICLLAIWLGHLRVTALPSQLQAYSWLKHLGWGHGRRSCMLLLLSGIHYYGTLFLLPIYLTCKGQHSLATVGLLVAMHGAGMLIGRYWTTRPSIRCSERTLLLMASCAALFGSCVLAWPALATSPAAIMAGMLLRGSGVGILTLSAMAGAYAGVKPAHTAQISALTRMVTLLGAALGCGIVAAALHPSVQGASANFAPAHLMLIALTLAGCLAIPLRRTQLL